MGSYINTNAMIRRVYEDYPNGSVVSRPPPPPPPIPPALISNGEIKRFISDATKIVESDPLITGNQVWEFLDSCNRRADAIVVIKNLTDNTWRNSANNEVVGLFYDADATCRKFISGEWINGECSRPTAIMVRRNLEDYTWRNLKGEIVGYINDSSAEKFRSGEWIDGDVSQTKLLSERNMYHNKARCALGDEDVIDLEESKIVEDMDKKWSTKHTNHASSLLEGWTDTINPKTFAPMASSGFVNMNTGKSYSFAADCRTIESRAMESYYKGYSGMSSGCDGPFRLPEAPARPFLAVSVPEETIKAVCDNPGDIEAVTKILYGVNSLSLLESIPYLGIDEQKYLASVPEMLNVLFPTKASPKWKGLDTELLDYWFPKGQKSSSSGAIDSSLSSLGDIKKIINRLGPTKTWYQSLFYRATGSTDDAMKESVGSMVESLRTNTDKLQAMKKQLVQISNNTKKCKESLGRQILAAKALSETVGEREKLAIANRLTSMALTSMIAEQTNQIIVVKETNLENLISVIRDTVFVYVPSWINQLEIHKQIDLSNEIDDVMLTEILENQKYIVERIESLQRNNRK